MHTMNTKLFLLGSCLLSFLLGTVSGTSLLTWQKDVMLAIRDGSASRLTGLFKESPGELPQLLHEGFCNSLTPLCYAAKTNSATVQSLLEAGVDPRQTHASTKTTPLMYAAMSGEAKAVEILLNILGPDDINAVDEHGSTALTLCSLSCHGHVARLLIGAGAAVFISDNNGNTALHIGAFYCGAKVSDSGESYAQALLENDSSSWTTDDIDVMSTNGRTALMLSAKQGGVGYAKVLLAAGANADIVSPVDHKTYHDFLREYHSNEL
jgi:ankyrin repeat protein